MMEEKKRGRRELYMRMTLRPRLHNVVDHSFDCDVSVLPKS
jgi:hypothetical protein